MRTISPLLMQFVQRYQGLIQSTPRGSLAGFLSANAWGFEELISGRTDGTYVSFRFAVHSQDEDYLRLSYRMIVRENDGVTFDQPLAIGSEDDMRADMAYHLRLRHFNPDMANTPMAYEFRFFVQHLVNELRTTNLPVSAFGY